jgi:16S rRNA (cytidine1402-2'-O)-methyltransferase
MDSNLDNASPSYFAGLTTLVEHQQYPVGTLYVVATPLGNVADITLRALEVLRRVDVVAAEDTRNTAQLLSRYGLQKNLLALHEHNESQVAQQLCGRLAQGERIALVSDAGTPGISDPGARAVAAVRAAGYPVVPLPGPSALITLASVAGLSDAPLYFAGFLPNKTTQRQHALQVLNGVLAHLIFYEAPHRILETVQALAAQWPARQLLIGRELTKQFEQIVDLPLSEAVAWLQQTPNHQRGEFVLMVSAPLLVEGEQAVDAEAERVLNILLSELPTKQAAQLAASITGAKKNALYARALALKANT